jgi:hypothetical protein
MRHYGVIRKIAACVLALQLAAPAFAAERDPLSYPLRHYGVILGMTLLGGFAGWYVKVSRGQLPGHSLFALIGEMAVSSLAGLGSFFVCDYMAVPLGITAAVAGLCGYMGGRAIELAEKALQQRVERLAGKE